MSGEGPFRTAVITGGGGGLGRALALAAARRGVEVATTDLDPNRASETAALVRELGPRSIGLALDVTHVESIATARERIHDELAAPDLLINNAGTVRGGRFDEIPLESHLDTYRVNLLGAVAVAHAFLPDLVARRRSQLVNIASASGFVALPFGTSYASSKWGLVGFSDSLRRELEITGRAHVGVTTVCPGYTDTGLFEGARAPRTTRFLEPDRLAERVLEAAERNRPFVMTPWLVRVAPALRGLLPTRLLDRVSDLFGATRSMEGWRGRKR